MCWENMCSSNQTINIKKLVRCSLYLKTKYNSKQTLEPEGLGTQASKKKIKFTTMSHIKTHKDNKEF